MSVPKVLLANEAGIGRGHIAKLVSIAKAIGNSVDFTAALARRKHADELTAIGARVIAAPAMGYSAEAAADHSLEGNATWGDYLCAMGLARETVLRNSLAYWRETIIAENASVLVTDYAPIAMLAARGLKAQGWQIDVVSAGTGYGVPPANMQSFPRLLPDYSRSVHQEPDVLAMINKVCDELFIPQLDYLPEIYEADLTLPSTLTFLDPYNKIRSSDEIIPPQVDRAADLAGGGDEIFMYLSTSEFADPFLLDAICALPMPRRTYCPAADPAVLERLRNSGVIVEMAPVAVEQITQRSAMILHASQHGILSLAAFAGLPQVGIPQHLEQVFHGRRAGQQGILNQIEFGQRSKQAVIDMVSRVYHDPAMRARARDFALHLRAITPVNTQNVLKERINAFRADRF